MDKDSMLILDRLANLANAPLLETTQLLDRTTAAIARLTPISCNGSVYWRDADIAGRQPKMYIIHKHGDTCPIHGTPKLANSRIRTYVGTNPELQAEALDAIDRYAKLRKLRSQHHAIELALASAYSRLKDYYRALQYTVPKFPNEYPEPQRTFRVW